MKVRLITEDGEIYEWRNVETIQEGFEKIFLFPPKEREQSLMLYHSESLISELWYTHVTRNYVAIDINNMSIERIEVLFERRWQLDEDDTGDRV